MPLRRKEKRILVMMHKLLHPLMHPFKIKKKRNGSLARTFYPKMNV
jgi:hypothetical protein